MNILIPIIFIIAAVSFQYLTVYLAYLPISRKAVTQWLPSSGYELIDGPEVEVTHWFYKEDDEALNNSRYCELWLPITKKNV